MAAHLNISIPPLKPDERVEDWQPLFVVATSPLAAHAGEKAAVLILPSYVCRNEYERETEYDVYFLHHLPISIFKCLDGFKCDTTLNV